MDDLTADLVFHVMSDLVASSTSMRDVLQLKETLASYYEDNDKELPVTNVFLGLNTHNLRTLLMGVCSVFHTLEMAYKAENGPERYDASDDPIAFSYHSSIEAMYLICIALDK